jgi:hypothetical protein
MFKRSRRSILCHVEQLEGRAAASTVVDSAVVFGVSDKVVHLRGHTTDVSGGERLYIDAVAGGTHHSILVYGNTVAVVENTGSFIGSIRAQHPWIIGRKLLVEIFEISITRLPQSNLQESLLTSEHIPIKLD